MKSELAKIGGQPFPSPFQLPLRLKKADFLWVILPALIWVGSIFMRQSVIIPRCTNETQKCSKESLLPVDLLSYGMEDPRADEYSFFTQNLSGTLAVLLPATLSFSRFAMGTLSPAVALSTVGVDLVLILQAATWNGVFLELTHLVVQRPRPFVYYDPAQRGADPAHYVSFYSGHTSFAAAMMVAVFLILWMRGAPLLLLLLSALAAETLIITTAYFRILAGRHFLTDVIMGALAGTTVAWVVVSRHRSRRAADSGRGAKLAPIP